MPKRVKKQRGGAAVYAAQVPTLPSSYQQAMAYAGYPYVYSNAVPGAAMSQFQPFVGPQVGGGFFDVFSDIGKGVVSGLSAIGRAAGVTERDSIPEAIFKGALGPITIGVKGVKKALDVTGLEPSEAAALAGAILPEGKVAKVAAVGGDIAKKRGRGRMQRGGQGIAQRPEYQAPGLYMQEMQNHGSFSFPVSF